MTFTEGLIVEYENYIGEIRFVCNSYVTFCINSFRNEKQRDVCVLIYHDHFRKIKLLKESEK
jgi:hypothetical protein